MYGKQKAPQNKLNFIVCEINPLLFLLLGFLFVSLKVDHIET